MAESLRVFMITSEWPTPERPHQVPFIVRQVNFLRQAGVDVHVFPFRGNKNPMNYVRAWQQARRALANGHFDLVHAQWGQSGLLALPKSHPLVVTFRGDDLEGKHGPNGERLLYGMVLEQVSRMVARTADQVIVVSDSLAGSMPKRSFHVIPSGLDLKMFSPTSQSQARQQLGLSEDKRYVLFAGSVDNPTKRYPLARHAVEQLQQELDVELLVATGISHELIPTYMNASDALLLTSAHEGSPNVVKEALACNLPVVSTDVGDVRLRIGNIPGCHVLPVPEPDTITAALRTVLQKGERVCSRSTILDLDEEVLTQKVINVYREALLVSKRA